MTRAIAQTVLAIAALGLIAGCQGGSMKISKLLDDPGQYDQKTVRVAGAVKESMGVMGYGAYQIDDGSGSIVVLTKENGAPRQGAKVGVEGEFRSAFTYGDKTAAVILEKTRVSE